MRMLEGGWRVVFVSYACGIVGVVGMMWMIDLVDGYLVGPVNSGCYVW